MAKIKIAIHGKARTGKDTTSSLFVSEFKNASQILKVSAFADPIKEIIMLMFPQANKDYLWGKSELRDKFIPEALDPEGNPLTYRRACIDVGKLGRTYNPDVWVNATLSREPNLISDLRFLNEFKRLRREKFKLIRLVRPINDYTVDDYSETELDHLQDEDFDYVIVNDGTKQDLLRSVISIVDSLT